MWEGIAGVVRGEERALKQAYTFHLNSAKVSDKIQLVENLMDKVDAMIIGGGMAFTFKKQIDGVKVEHAACAPLACRRLTKTRTP